MNAQSSRPASPSRAAVVVSVLVAVVCGAAVATQSRINGELGQRLNDGFTAALISFGSGLAIVGIVTAFSPKGRRGLGTVIRAVRSGSLPWYYICGGAAGAFLVLSQGLVAATLGVALFTIGVVAGQTISGLLIDRRGVGTVPPKPLTAQRLIGAALALVSVGIAVSAQLTTSVPLWMLLLPFLAGLGIAWQQGVNGQVGATAGTPLTATLVNFIMGTAVLLVAALVHSGFAGWPTSFPTEPWLYIGGVLGVCFIGAAAVLVRVIGVLLLGLGTVAGQLIASLVIDLAAPASGHVVAASTIVGSVLTLVAVVIAAVPSSVLRRRTKEPDAVE